MSQQFFPITGKQVVPLVRMDDDDGVTFVQARQNGSKPEEQAWKLRIFRFAIGKLVKASFIKIDSSECDEPERPNRNWPAR